MIEIKERISALDNNYKRWSMEQVEVKEERAHRLAERVACLSAWWLPTLPPVISPRWVRLWEKVHQIQPFVQGLKGRISCTMICGTVSWLFALCVCSNNSVLVYGEFVLCALDASKMIMLYVLKGEKSWCKLVYTTKIINFKRKQHETISGNIK